MTGKRDFEVVVKTVSFERLWNETSRTLAEGTHLVVPGRGVLWLAAAGLKSEKWKHEASHGHRTCPLITRAVVMYVGLEGTSANHNSFPRRFSGGTCGSRRAEGGLKAG